LKEVGYDDTITLEVFSADHHYLQYSRDVLRKVWDDTSPNASRREPAHAHAGGNC
jgi:hypothetical protein